MVGFFSQTAGDPTQNHPSGYVFPTKTERIGQQRGMVVTRVGARNQMVSPPGPLGETTASFATGDNLLTTFKVSEWPFVQTSLASTLTLIIDRFISFALEGS
jgi:hypothetical protein